MKRSNPAVLLALAAILALSAFLPSAAVEASSTVLKEGMQGSEVIELQNNLKQIGYFKNDCTGYYGSITSDAVRRLQKDYGVEQDGTAGSATIALISKLISAKTPKEPSQVLKIGAEGSEVVELQNGLKQLGYFNEDCTGYYGSVTAGAVKNLQRDYGYIQDGIAGSDTIALVKRLITALGSNGASPVLKKGMNGSGVVSLQNDLKQLGFFNGDCTGFYGDITANAVKSLQSKYGYTQDGIAGKSTFALIDKLLGRTVNAANTAVASAAPAAPQAATGQEGYLIPWFNNGEKVFAIGKTASIYDIASGLSFNVKRTYGYNHADCETLSAEDTDVMKKIFGGEWSWDRRAIILTVDGRSIAASMAGMPHAGYDAYEKNITISSRSGGYGRGANLDAVKNNKMDGVFDVHLYKSKTHGTNRVDENHQKMVKKAEEWAKNNL
jgi:peptidoglycan hydrolase-like protein with peptidoglycan-binding domain